MTTPLPCPFCGEEPHFEGDPNYWGDEGYYVEMSLTCCSTMNEAIGWKRGREMTSAARAAELKAKLTEAWDKRAAQPDCRTCHYFAGLEGCWRHYACDNGDQYQEATKVVLWRTE